MNFNNGPPFNPPFGPNGMPIFPPMSVVPPMTGAPGMPLTMPQYPPGRGPLAGRPMKRGANGLFEAPEPEGPEEHEAKQFMKLNPGEEVKYGQYWSEAVGDEESVGGKEAVAFLGRANKVSKGQLRRIWDIADHRKEGVLGRDEFYVALRLVALAQRGAELSVAGLRNFTGIQLIPDIAPEEKKEEVEVHEPPKPTGFSWIVGKDVVQRYDAFFKSLDGAQRGAIDGRQGVEFFGKSGLPRPTLKRIWELADVTRDGLLSLDEFRVAMHMVANIRNKKLTVTALPSALDPNGPNWLRVEGEEPQPQLSPQQAAHGSPQQPIAMPPPPVEQNEPIIMAPPVQTPPPPMQASPQAQAPPPMQVPSPEPVVVHQMPPPAPVQAMPPPATAMAAPPAGPSAAEEARAVREEAEQMRAMLRKEREEMERARREMEEMKAEMERLRIEKASIGTPVAPNHTDGYPHSQASSVGSMPRTPQMAPLSGAGVSVNMQAVPLAAHGSESKPVAAHGSGPFGAQAGSPRFTPKGAIQLGPPSGAPQMPAKGAAIALGPAGTVSAAVPAKGEIRKEPINLGDDDDIWDQPSPKASAAPGPVVGGASKDSVSSDDEDFWAGLGAKPTLGAAGNKKVGAGDGSGKGFGGAELDDWAF